MKSVAFLTVILTCSLLRSEEIGDIGRTDPPFVEASASLSTRLLNNAEKRCDMVRDLSDKSEMNYRVLAMKIMEKWQASAKSDKTFLKEIMKHKMATFTVHKDGTIDIEGTDPKQDSAKGGKTRGDKGTPAEKPSNDPDP